MIDFQSDLITEINYNIKLNHLNKIITTYIFQSLKLKKK